ncbi:hypothetical protein Scani_19430 [Streptomyces caniferus]|uniref:Uncharacterized protein n=1 Tax=Streptomyces caniferus TaxID=285557 RepID=A0A640S7U1_9ACTN|nr:hypothetical protein Scani_19430 [Streptomyces caniferus]
MDGAAGEAWCPAALSFWTTCEPISPVPPITVNFMAVTFHGATGHARGSWRTRPSSAVLSEHVPLALLRDTPSGQRGHPERSVTWGSGGTCLTVALAGVSCGE